MLSLVFLAFVAVQDPRPAHAGGAPPAAEPDLVGITSPAVAIDHQEDGFRLLGPGWEAGFAHGRTRIAVTSADRSEERSVLALELESIGRGSDVERVHSPAPHAVVDQTVERTVYPGVREVWTAGAAGVELSYVFVGPPPGQGDLVVRLYADAGGLEPERDDGGWLFGEGAAALRVGEVLGVDADGNQAPGEVRTGDGWIELLLPAGFVDSARYPLVLDPPIGPARKVALTGNSDSQPDLVKDPYSGNWAIVFERRLATNSYEVWSAVVNQYGSTVGWPVRVGHSASPMSPTIAYSSQFQLFVLAYVEDWSPGAGGFNVVRVETMTLEPRIFTEVWAQLYAAPGYVKVDLGTRRYYSEVLLATTQENGSCWAQVLEYEPFGGPFSTKYSLLLGTSGVADSPVRVQKFSESGKWFLVWGERPFSNTKIRGAIVDHEGFFRYGPVDLLADPEVDYREPAIAGDSVSHSIVYVRDDGTDEILMDLLCYCYGYSAGLRFKHRISLDTGNYFVGLRTPDVAFTGGGFVITWSRQSWGTSIQAASLDIGGYLCEPPWTVASGFVGTARVTGTFESYVAYGPVPETTEARIAWSDSGIYLMPVDDCE